jgi:hypothetical protein
MVPKSILLSGTCPFRKAPSLKFYSARVWPSWGPLGPFCVQGLEIIFSSGAFFFLTSVPKSNFLREFYTFWGRTVAFGFQRLKIKFYFWGIYPSLESRNLICPWRFCPFLYLKFKFDFGGFCPFAGARSREYVGWSRTGTPLWAKIWWTTISQCTGDWEIRQMEKCPKSNI